MRRIASLSLALVLFVGVLSSAYVIHSVRAGTLTVPNDYLTIQEAINHAVDGDTVFVRDGLYPENVVVNRTISLCGQNEDTTIVDGNGMGNVVSIAVNDVSISGFTVRNSGHACPNHGIYVMPKVNCSSITGNTVIACQYGISLGSYSCNNMVSNNTLADNEISIICLEDSFQNRLAGNTITHSGYGIYLYHSLNGVLSNNSIVDCYDFGIILSYANNSLVEDNYAEDDGNGICVQNSMNVTVLGNNVTSNMNQGILLTYSSGNLIVGNVVAQSGDSNINIWASHNNTIRSNVMLRHWLALIIHYGSSGNEILENTFYGDYAPYSSSNNTFYHNNFYDGLSGATAGLNSWDDRCEGNYWSDYNGTDADNDGIGDIPYVIDSNNVDHYPLMNPYWIPADVNHDLIVNIFDVVKITGAYGATPTSLKWNPHADIAEPFSVINIFDVVLCTSHYGKKNP